MARLVALPPLLLGLAIARGWLAYGGLIAYALADRERPLQA
jgi:hypothetical protein